MAADWRFWKLLRQANDIVGQVLLVFFFIVLGATPLTILILGIVNFVRAFTRRGTIILQALVALIVWLVLTYALVMIFIVVVFSLPYPLSAADELKGTGLFFVACLIYAAVGAALIYWTKVQARLSRATQSSSNFIPGEIE